MHTGYVVDGVTHQCLEINHQMRRHAKLCGDASDITPLSIHGVDDGDVLIDQLTQIFVAAGNDHLNALLGCQYSQSANDIIGFNARNI